MRLITHNMMASNVKGVKNGFPLRLEVEEVETRDADYNPEFLKSMFRKLDWKALVDCARTVGKELPENVTVDMLEDESFLKVFHHVLLEIHVEQGSLICPESGRRFPIRKGIPNMLLREDEC